MVLYKGQKGVVQMGMKTTCTLCGSRLDHKKRCTFCGLDNRKSDKNYNLNPSDSERESIIHTHQRQVIKTPKKSTKSQKIPKDFYDDLRCEFDIPKVTCKKASKEKNRKVNIIATIIVLIITFGGVIVDSVKEIMEDNNINASSEVTEQDPYAFAERQLSEEGDTYKTTLAAGYYIVGEQLPEGTYTLTLQEGEGYVRAESSKDMIYLWEDVNDDEGKETIEDFRLYQGALVCIVGDAVLDFESDNAQIKEMQTLQKNPLKETIILNEGGIAGMKFPAGIYDIYAKDGYGSIQLYVPDHIIEAEDGEVYSTEDITLDAEKEDDFGISNSCKNVVIPEGTEIRIDGVEIRLVPSEKIGLGDYLAFYDKGFW